MTDPIARQPKGRPSGGQFAPGTHAADDIDLAAATDEGNWETALDDGVLDSFPHGADHTWASSYEGIDQRVPFTSADLLADPDRPGFSTAGSVDIWRDPADNSLNVFAVFDTVDMVQFAANYLNAEPDGPGSGRDLDPEYDEEELLGWLNDHGDAIQQFWSEHNIEATGDEWNAEVLQRRLHIEPDDARTLTWRGVGERLVGDQSFRYLRDGLGDPAAALPLDLAAHLSGKPASFFAGVMRPRA